MKKKTIPYSRQSIEEDDIRTVTRILRSDFITQGPLIEEFENSLAEKVGSRYAVVLNSGTAALHAAYSAAGIGKGDEVITSSLTFAATANAALYLGARPVFSDTEPDTGNLDIGPVREKITSNTRLIVPVHFGGHPADMEKYYETGKEHNISIIEDASHALGAFYKGEPIGNCRFSDMTTCSFHPVKHITSGEGGVVFTNNEQYDQKLRAFRNHGIRKTGFKNSEPGPWYYEMHELGFNYRITDIQAGLGMSQLKKLERFVRRRREIAERYNKAFQKDDRLILPVEKNYARSSYHLYPIRLKDPKKRKEVFEKLREQHIWVQVHYIPVYFHPYYREKGYPLGTCPHTEDYYNSMISIPVYPTLSEKDQDHVIQLVKKFTDES